MRVCSTINMYLFVSEYGPVVELRINNAKGGGGKLPVSNLKVHQHYYSHLPPPLPPHSPFCPSISFIHNIVGTCTYICLHHYSTFLSFKSQMLANIN